MRDRKWTIAGCALFGLALAACSSGAGTPAGGMTSSAAATLKSSSTSIGMVLTNAKGRTLYWFAIDTPTRSKCSGACASTWPPVTGSPRVTGLAATGRLGTVKRSGGTVQVTWNGHPLYTYAGDRAAGQVNGNGISGFGGLWHAVVLTGAGMHSGSPSAHPTKSGGGY